MSDMTIHVLVVDDDTEQREDLVEWLNRESMKATAVDSGEKALALLKEETTVYEVLIADQMLQAGIDGLTLLKQVKAEYPSLEVVLFSGKDPATGLAALRAGAYRYITKPFSLEELTFVVQQAAEHRKLKQEAVLSKLAGVVQSMTGKISDGLGDILQQAVESAISLLGADCGVLYLYDTTKQEFYFDRQNVIHIGLRNEPVLKNKPRPTGMAQHVRQQGIIVVNNVTQDLPEDFRGNFLERESIKSFVGIAIRTAEEMTQSEVGVLYLNFRKPHRFTDDEKSVIQVFANLVASVVRSAWLLERTRELAEQQTTLREIANIINAELDPREVADRILDELRKVVEYRMASMQRIHGDVRTQLAGRGFGPGSVPNWALKPISKDRLIKPIVDSRQTFIISDLSQIPENTHWQRHTETEHIQSWACVPLIYGDEVIGLLTLDHDQPGYYRPAHKAILTLYAMQAAIAIRNAELVADLQRQIKGREMLNRMGIELSSLLDEGAILHGVARAAAETISSTHCTVFCIEDEKLTTRASYGNRGSSYPLGRAFPIGEGVAGWVAKHNKVALIGDSRTDPRFFPGWSAPQPDPLSLLDVPIVIADEVYGVISVEHDESHAFDKQDQQLLELLALQTGQAMLNARLFHQEQQRSKILSDLQQVTATISATLDLQRSLERIVKSAVELTKSDAGIIYVIDTARMLIETAYEYPKTIKHPLPRFSERKGLTWEIFNSKKMIEVLDVPNDPRVSEEFAKSGVYVMLGVPLIIQTQVNGVLFLNIRERRGFTDEQKSVLTILAEQGAIAIQNARLYHIAQERATRFTKLQEVAMLILAEPANLKSVANVIVNSLKEIFEGAYCAIRLYDPIKGEFNRLLSSQESAVATYYLPRPDGISAYVAKTLRPVYIEDTTAPSLPEIPSVRPERIAEGIRAAAYLPLIGEGRLIGRLSVYWEQPQHFSEDDKPVLALFANQAAIAVKNASMYQHSRQQFETLQEIIGTIGSSEDPLPLILEGATALFDAHYGSFSLADSDARLLAFYAIFENGNLLVGDNIPEGKRFRSWDTGITGAVARTGKSALIGNVKDAKGYEKWYDNTASELAVALRDADEQVIGVLNLESPVSDTFDKEAERLCRRFADVAALAIEKARSLKIQRHLQALYQVAQTLDIDDVLDRILEGVNAVIGEGASSSISLYDENTRTFNVYRAAGILQEVLLIPPRSDDTSTGAYVIHKQKPLFLTDVKNPPEGCPTIRQASIDSGVQSFAALPLEQQGRVFGVLFINVTRAIAFTTTLRRDLELFTRQAAIAIENVQLLKERAKRAERLERLQKVTAAISERPFDLEVVLETLVNQILQMSGGISCTIRPYDTVSRQLGIRVGAGSMASKLTAFPPRPEGTTAYLLQGKPLYISDTSLEPPAGQPKVHPEAVAAGVKAIAYLPLIYEGDIKGILYLNFDEIYHFTENDKQIMDLFAGQAAVAIHNARFYRSQIEAIRGISQTIATFQVRQKVLEGILDSALVLMGQAASGEFQSIDETTNQVIVEAVKGKVIQEQYRRMPIGQGITGWVAQHRQAQLVPDVTRDDRYIGFLEGTGSEIAVPMKKGDKVIGVFNIEHPRIDALTQNHLRLAEAIADLAVVAIENAELYEQLQQQKADQIGAILEISTAIVSSLSREEILQGLLDSTLLLMGEASLGEIRLLSNNILTSIVASGEKRDEIYKDISIEEGITGWVAEHGESLLIADVRDDPRFLSYLEGTRSEVAVPMRIGSQIIGVLNIEHPKVNAFTEQDLRLAEAMASLATVTVENTRLYQQRLKDIAALQEINTAITQKPLTEVAQLIVKKAAELTDGEFSGLWLMDEERRGLKFGAMHGIEPLEQWIPLDDKSFNGYVAMTGETFNCPDLSQTEHNLNWFGDGSRLGTPMKFGDNIVGTLYVHSPRFDAFTDYHAQLLESLAAQAAISLENTRLLAETRRSLQKRTEILGDLGSSLADLEVEI